MGENLTIGDLVITDPTSAKAYGNGPLSRWCARHLQDPRDEVFVRLTLKMLPLHVVLMTGVWFAIQRAPVPTWLPIAGYMAIWGWLTPPVILMLHCTMHRPFFKSGALSKAHAFVLAALSGIPTAYRVHHTGMHHVEDNMGEDLSSTIRYRRDSFLHFLRYFFRFLFVIFEMPPYLWRRKRFQLARRAVVGEVTQYAIVGTALAIDWRFGLATFALPFITCRFMMMVGNWGQHAFINVERRNNGLANSITCINSPYNQRCFNDGYHIGHHLRANTHWTEYPEDLARNKEKYAENGAIVFQGLDFFLVSVLLWTKQYKTLARRFVRLGAPMTDDEVIALLQKRVLPVVDAPAVFVGRKAAA